MVTPTMRKDQQLPSSLLGFSLQVAHKRTSPMDRIPENCGRLWKCPTTEPHRPAAYSSAHLLGDSALWPGLEAWWWAHFHQLPWPTSPCLLYRLDPNLLFLLMDGMSLIRCVLSPGWYQKHTLYLLCELDLWVTSLPQKTMSLKS